VSTDDQVPEGNSSDDPGPFGEILNLGLPDATAPTAMPSAPTEKYVSDLVSLQGFRDDQIALLFDTFRIEAMRLFDVEIELGNPPEEHQAELADLMISLAAGIRCGDISPG
jgi:hypothetical protein